MSRIRAARRLPGSPPAALAVTADPQVTDDILRLGAAVGVAVSVVPDALAAVPLWQGADLALVDEQAATGVRVLGLPRRPRTVLLAPGPVPNRVWQDAVAVGVTAVVNLPEGETWLAEALAEATGRLNSLAPVVAVVGSRGGAGASTLAVAMAWVAAEEGLASYLLDLDPLGCGAQVLLGVDQLSGVGWNSLGETEGRVPPRLLRGGLPNLSGVRLLGWTDEPADAGVALPSGVAGAVVDAAARDGDVVVVDLPRWSCVGPDRAFGFATEVMTRSSLVVLVSPADVRSAIAGKRLLARAELAGLPAGLVVRGPCPGGLTADDVAAALDLPLLTFVPFERSLDRLVEDGFPPGSKRGSGLHAAARSILLRLADARAEVGPG
ncbi:MAG: septum formation initiator [Actinobacteria bacterium]|nr:septum formation initiator [Actinomycetota bacterium]